MEIAVPIGMCVLLGAPAVKLLVQARRDGGGPEIWAGGFFLGIAVGMPLRMLGVTLMQDGLDVGPAVNLVGHLGLFGGTLALTIFTWRVFHPDSARVMAAAMLLVVLQIATTGFGLVTGAVHDEASNAIIATNAMRTAPMCWACVESLRYWRRMRRRTQVGLADPVVSNRFALWAIWTGAFAGLPTAALVLRVVLPMTVPDPNDAGAIEALMTDVLAQLRLLLAVTGVIGVGALVLSFFPPAWYLARLRASVSAAEA